MPNERPSLVSSESRGVIESERRVKSPAVMVSDGQTSEAYRFLSSINIFADLPARDLKVLADSSRFESVAPGEYITVEGDEESLYGFIVVSGRLAMIKTSIGGKELIVELLGVGDIFGLLVMLSNEKLPAQLSARSHSMSQVLWVRMKSLMPILQAHASFNRTFVSYLLHSLQSSYRISRGLAHDRVEVRIATILVSLAQRFARPLPTVQDNTIDITRQQIADLTGTTPETAIRVTRQMQRDGLIDIKRPGVVRVIDLEAMQELAEGE